MIPFILSIFSQAVTSLSLREASIVSFLFRPSYFVFPRATCRLSNFRSSFASMALCASIGYFETRLPLLVPSSSHEEESAVDSSTEQDHFIQRLRVACESRTAGLR